MRMKPVVAGVVILVVVLMLLVVSLTWGGHSRAMVALAAADLPLVANAMGLSGAFTIRSERLLPTTAGRPLEGDEDFVEIWSDAESKVGWIYYEIDADLIRLLGCQAVNGEYLPLAGQWIALPSIAQDQVRSALIDGKEFQ